MGNKRLGPPDAATRAAIESIEDEDTLGRLFEHILEVASWPALLAHLAFEKKWR